MNRKRIIKERLLQVLSCIVCAAILYVLCLMIQGVVWLLKNYTLITSIVLICGMIVAIIHHVRTYDYE